MESVLKTYPLRCGGANNPPLDSKEGMEILFGWAKSSGAVLSEYHERLAVKHGVSTEGVRISRPLPVLPS